MCKEIVTPNEKYKIIAKESETRKIQVKIVIFDIYASK